jgi:Ssp1 endopeptidase immunity protein Rap1a
VVHRGPRLAAAPAPWPAAELGRYASREGIVKVFSAALAISALVGTPFAYAEDNGTLLLSTCETYLKYSSEKAYPNQQASFNAGQCWGIINGLVVANYMLINENSPRRQPWFCAPKNPSITTDQSIRIVTSFLQSHPEVLHRPAHGLILTAHMEAFPCK